MSSQISQQEIEIIIEIYKLLEFTFKGKDNKKIEESTKKLKEITKNIKNSINILFKALSITKLSNEEISLEIHKSVSLYLKNIILSEKNLQLNEISNYLNQIFDLIFNKSKENIHLNDNTIFNAFQKMIYFLLSSKKIINQKDFINRSFNIILTNLKNTSIENFLQISKSAILLSSSLFSCKSADVNNYEHLLNDYYIPIINIIFFNVPNFIYPKNNIYNIEFITVIKLLLDGFYTNLSKMKELFISDKIKDITMIFFREYGNYCFELLQLVPEFNDENMKYIYENKNPIIVFNNNKKICYEMNQMKSKAFQFLSFIIKISTLDEGYTEENIKNKIIDGDLQKMIKNLIALIIKSFQDILSNKEKYNNIRKYSEDGVDEEDNYNDLLYQICTFLMYSLIREPIKTEFSGNMKQFFLDILFPLIVTVDDEKTFMENDPDGYHQYLNDIIFRFKTKNFRTSAFFLVKTICDEFIDVNNFISSFFLEMLNYILQEGKAKSEIPEYNIFLKNQENALISQFNDKIKLDFCLLILLILKFKINQNDYLIKRFFGILIENYEKMHLIRFKIIKIKLCKIYYYYIPMFFRKEKRIIDEKKIKFINDVINYLLDCIIQKDLKPDEEYSQALSYEASSTIIELMSLQKDSNSEINILILKQNISQNIINNFGIIINLIPSIDIYTFFSLIEQIIETTKISPRYLIFDCLNYLTKKFISLYSQKSNSNKLFYTQYFSIISSFFKGVNKISPENNEEISKFNTCFDPILNYIKEPDKFSYNEQLISTVELCMKNFKSINERSIFVLEKIKIIIQIDSCINSSSYDFISTFLFFFQKKIREQSFKEEEIKKILNNILEIINKSFSFLEETFESSKIYSLSLILQILIINPNLDTKILEYLILQSFESFKFNDIEEDKFFYIKIINQLSLANISLGLIFNPELIFKLLLQKNEIISKFGEKIEYIRLSRYINMIRNIIQISYPYYYPTIGKFIILGICSILSNNFCKVNLNENLEHKINLLKIFIKLMLFHKEQKCKILEYLMKKELKINFVKNSDENDIDNDEEEESDDDDEDEEKDDDVKENEFIDNIEQILSTNNTINNSDEFVFFKIVMKNIKENDQLTYTQISEKIKKGIKAIEFLSKIRNIKIKYNGKDYTVPRKILKIVRKSM